jgi:imidazolonepropionase
MTSSGEGGDGGVIEADLLVVGAAEVVTCRGPAPRSEASQADSGVIAGGGVAAREGRIVFVGPETEMRASVELRPGGKIVDAAGGCVLPGLVDPHTHIPFAGWREAEFERRIAGESYADIARAGGGILATVRATREASREGLASLVRDRLDRMLLHGTTTVEAKSGYGLTLEDEMKQLDALADAGDHPVDIVPTLLGAHVVPLEYRDRRADYVDLVKEKMVPTAARGGRAEYCDVFVEEGAFTVDEARAIFTAARKGGLGARVHAEQFTPSGGAMLAVEVGAASVDHLERIDSRCAEALARAGVVGVLLPGASLFAGGGQGAPGRLLIDSGVPIAIASDFNPGTCPCESVAAMIPLACLLCGLSPDEAIVAATINAAASLGRSDQTGSLEPGKRADIAIFSLTDRRQLAYRFGTNHCTDVVKNGRPVVRRGVRVSP